MDAYPQSVVINGVPSSEPILGALRRATDSMHRGLEKRLDLERAFGTLAHYRAWLAAQWGMLAPFEARLARFDWTAAGLNFSERRRVPLLEADLGELGLSPSAIRALPCCNLLPDPPTRDAAFGCLYVLEGSTLGGQILLRRAHASLNVTEQRGAAFLAAGGRRIGADWQQFRGALATACADVSAAAAMASASFAAIEAWLDVNAMLQPRPSQEPAA